MKYRLLAFFAFVFVWSCVGVVFGNPIPWNPPWFLGFIQIFSIVSAEFCGILAGVAVLVRNPHMRWPRSTLTVTIALVLSYVVGMVIWTVGYVTGIFFFNPTNMRFLLFFPHRHPLALVILLLPEFIGVALGTVIIHRLQPTRWKTAFIAMTAAMLASFLLAAIIGYIHLHTEPLIVLIG